MVVVLQSGVLSLVNGKKAVVGLPSTVNMTPLCVADLLLKKLQDKASSLVAKGVKRQVDEDDEIALPGLEIARALQLSPDLSVTGLWKLIESQSKFEDLCYPGVPKIQRNTLCCFNIYFPRNVSDESVMAFREQAQRYLMEAALNTHYALCRTKELEAQYGVQRLYAYRSGLFYVTVAKIDATLKFGP